MYVLPHACATKGNAQREWFQVHSGLQTALNHVSPSLNAQASYVRMYVTPVSDQSSPQGGGVGGPRVEDCVRGCSA